MSRGNYIITKAGFTRHRFDSMYFKLSKFISGKNVQYYTRVTFSPVYITLGTCKQLFILTVYQLHPFLKLICLYTQKKGKAIPVTDREGP
jgi:hypothetical protein